MYGKDYELDKGKVQFVDGYIDWVTEGVYLRIKLIEGKSFKTDISGRKRKFLLHLIM